MIFNSSQAEAADEEQQEFVKDLSEYKLNEKQIKIMKYMSKSMKDYNMVLMGFGIIWSIFLLLLSFAFADPKDDLADQKFVALFNPIVFIFVFWRTRKTALSFQSIAQKGSLSELRKALDNLKELYNLERIVVVLILILISGKTLIDLLSYWFPNK